MPPVTAVVSADSHLPQPSQLLLKDDPLLRPTANNAQHAYPAAMQALGNGMHHGSADPAPDAEGAARFD